MTTLKEWFEVNGIILNIDKTTLMTYQTQMNSKKYKGNPQETNFWDIMLIIH